MRIAIAGAGIGGLTAALALARAGREVTVFERATALTPVGAGLQLSPNALDVLDRLGVARDLEGRAVPAETVTLRRGSSGRAIARIPVGSQDGRGYLSLLRADLQDVLLAGAQAEPRIELRFGHEIVAARREPAWILQFSQDHPDARCDVLVAADGVHSGVGTLLGGAPARNEGVAAVRLRVRQPASPGIEAWLGARAHAVAYPIAAGRETNLVLIGPDAEVAEAPASFFDGWDKRLLGLIEAGDTLGVWPLLTRTPRWRAPGLAYLGDAAHAMLPYAAQGAAMAIEDGWVLASCLARSPDVGRALHDYEAARATRVARVLSRVAFHRRVYHLPAPASFARDLVLMATPAKRLTRQLAWLYDWHAPPIDFATD